MRKVCISYCLYGDYKKYSTGLISSLHLLHKNSFCVHVAVSDELPSSFCKMLEDLGCKVRVYPRLADSDGMFERINLHQHIDDFDVIFVRDTDSIITKHEILFMHQFIESDYLLHVIRSHPLHDRPVMGGLFGYKPDVAKYLRRYSTRLVFNLLKQRSRYGSDQSFLLFVYERFRRQVLVHSTGNFMKQEAVVRDKASSAENYCGMPTFGTIAPYNYEFKDIGTRNIMRKLLIVKLYNLLSVL